MTQAEETRLSVPVGERDHIRGPADAPITLVEYGDYECPYCDTASPFLRGLRRRLGDRLRVVFRHFPRTEIHPHAQHAAEAAEAAGAQGQFWEMHDRLFAHQQALEDADLVRYAGELGLDVERFARDLAEHVYAARVREDVSSGLESGVSRTPTFFVNGVRQGGVFNVPALMDAIETLAAARGEYRLGRERESRPLNGAEERSERRRRA
jgi:protein-disulfide isomerase